MSQVWFARYIGVLVSRDLSKVEMAKLVLITRLQHALGVMLLKYMVRRNEVCIKEGRHGEGGTR